MLIIIIVIIIINIIAIVIMIMHGFGVEELEREVCFTLKLTAAVCRWETCRGIYCHFHLVMMIVKVDNVLGQL